MRYRPPITDRTQADISNKTPKGYFNVSDWVRIYENAWMLRVLLNTELDLSVVFAQSPTPTVTSLPSHYVFNSLIANIDLARTAALLSGTPSSAVSSILTITYETGQTALAPRYTDVNEWEATVDSVRRAVQGALEYRVYCGAAVVGQTRMHQHRWFTYPDWTPEAPSPVRQPRTGPANVGRPLMQQNGFRRY